MQTRGRGQTAPLQPPRKKKKTKTKTTKHLPPPPKKPPLKDGEKFLQHSQLQPAGRLTEGKTTPDLIEPRNRVQDVIIQTAVQKSIFKFPGKE